MVYGVGTEYAVYMIGGLKPGFEASAKNTITDVVEDNVNTRSFNLSLDVGVGLDIYYPLFKFPPELRFSRGTNLIGEPNDYSAGLERVNTNTISLIFFTIMDHPVVLITGATSGIGEAVARLLAANDYRLILCGRRKERLDALERELSARTTIHLLAFDVRDRDAVESHLSSLPDKWQDIDILINNAGNAHGFDQLQEGNPDDWDAMIDINVKGLLYVTRQVVPGMIQRGKGHVVNIGSIAGKEVYPRGNVYCASKFAVDAISQGLRMDINGTGLRISAVNPGLVETEFSLVRFKGDEDRADTVYQNIEALQATDIADAILYIITRPAHITIADMTILPTAQASATLVAKNK